jgi:hypothetical protein
MLPITHTDVDIIIKNYAIPNKNTSATIINGVKLFSDAGIVLDHLLKELNKTQIDPNLSVKNYHPTGNENALNRSFDKSVYDIQEVINKGDDDSDLESEFDAKMKQRKLNKELQKERDFMRSVALNSAPQLLTDINNPNSKDAADNFARGSNFNADSSYSNELLLSTTDKNVSFNLYVTRFIRN